VIVLEVVIRGQLTRDAMTGLLAPVSVAIKRTPDPCAVLVDCLAMTGYDLDARKIFVEWNAEHRRRVDRVAIVTDKQLWQLVITAMALASGQRMAPFSTRSAGREWAEGRPKS
jgi:hypothetical protein